jgi:hypothetical protein
MAVLPAALESLLPVSLGLCASAGDDTAGCGELRREPSEGDGESMVMLFDDLWCVIDGVKYPFCRYILLFNRRTAVIVGCSCIKS